MWEEENNKKKKKTKIRLTNGEKSSTRGGILDRRLRAVHLHLEGLLRQASFFAAHRLTESANEANWTTSRRCLLRENAEIVINYWTFQSRLYPRALSYGRINSVSPICLYRGSVTREQSKKEEEENGTTFVENIDGGADSEKPRGHRRACVESSGENNNRTGRLSIRASASSLK